MASQGYRSVTAGALLAETVARVAASRDAALIYLVVLVAGNVFSDYLAAHGGTDASNLMSASLLKLGIAILSIVATYLLIENMAGKSGQLATGLDRRYIGYLGQGILVALGIAGGMILLVVPGVILACRWVLAPALLVGRGDGAVEAIGKSWHMTKGHAMPIFLAALALFVAPIVIFAVASIISESAIPSLIFQNVAATGISVLSAAMSVAALRLIDPGSSEMEDIFA